MEEDDVTGLDQLGEVAGAVLEDLFVFLLLGRPERPAVSGMPVELVVEALGDREELGSLAQHYPACVDSRIVRVWKEAAEHLVISWGVG